MALLTDPTAELIAFSGLAQFPDMQATKSPLALYPATYPVAFEVTIEENNAGGSQEFWTTS